MLEDNKKNLKDFAFVFSSKARPAFWDAFFPKCLISNLRDINYNRLAQINFKKKTLFLFLYSEIEIKNLFNKN